MKRNSYYKKINIILYFLGIALILLLALLVYGIIEKNNYLYQNIGVAISVFLALFVTVYSDKRSHLLIEADKRLENIPIVVFYNSFDRVNLLPKDKDKTPNEISIKISFRYLSQKPIVIFKIYFVDNYYSKHTILELNGVKDFTFRISAEENELVKHIIDKHLSNKELKISLEGELYLRDIYSNEYVQNFRIPIILVPSTHPSSNRSIIELATKNIDEPPILLNKNTML